MRKIVFAILFNCCFGFVCAYQANHKGFTFKGQIDGIEDSTRISIYNIEEQSTIA